MSMQDPIADMLTRIRNGQMVNKEQISMSSSKVKIAIAQVLEKEGYIRGFDIVSGKKHSVLNISLKYFEGHPVIISIKRVSRPGLRVYKKAGELPRVMGSLGISIVSTSQGLMTDRTARNENCGGEILCTVA